MTPECALGQGVFELTGSKVLVADDDAVYRSWLILHLEQAGYAVISAADGVEALSQVQVERPDLILLDAMMPRMDGFEVLKRLKAEPATAGIPVVMLMAMPALAMEYAPIYGPGEWFVSDALAGMVIKPLLKDPALLIQALAELPQLG